MRAELQLTAMEKARELVVTAARKLEKATAAQELVETAPALGEGEVQQRELEKAAVVAGDRHRGRRVGQDRARPLRLRLLLRRGRRRPSLRPRRDDDGAFASRHAAAWQRLLRLGVKLPNGAAAAAKNGSGMQTNVRGAIGRCGTATAARRALSLARAICHNASCTCWQSSACLPCLPSASAGQGANFVAVFC